MGVFAGIVFWSKYTITGFYIGLFAAYAVIMFRAKQGPQLLKAALFALIGALIVTLPIIAFFAANNALDALFENYFYNNIKLYPAGGTDSGALSPIINIASGLAFSIVTNGICTLLLACGAYRLLSGIGGHRNEALAVILSFSVLAATTFIGGMVLFAYYALILDCFAPLGALAALCKLKKTEFNRRMNAKNRALLTAAVGVLLLVSGTFMSRNTYLLKYKKEDMPQYKFASVISNETDKTMLNYGFLDGGFYFAAQKTPECKYFCKLNLPLDLMDEEQKRMIEEQRVDLVVTRGKTLEEHGVCCSGYRLISSEKFLFEGTEFTYYLYRLEIGE